MSCNTQQPGRAFPSWWAVPCGCTSNPGSIFTHNWSAPGHVFQSLETLLQYIKQSTNTEPQMLMKNFFWVVFIGKFLCATLNEIQCKLKIPFSERVNGLQVLKYYLKADWHYILLLLPVKPVGVYLGGKYPLICNSGKKHHLPPHSNHSVSHSSSHWHF